MTFPTRRESFGLFLTTARRFGPWQHEEDDLGGAHRATDLCMRMRRRSNQLCTTTWLDERRNPGSPWRPWRQPSLVPPTTSSVLTSPAPAQCISTKQACASTYATSSNLTTVRLEQARPGAESTSVSTTLWPISSTRNAIAWIWTTPASSGRSCAEPWGIRSTRPSGPPRATLSLRGWRADVAATKSNAPVRLPGRRRRSALGKFLGLDASTNRLRPLSVRFCETTEGQVPSAHEVSS